MITRSSALALAQSPTQSHTPVILNLNPGFLESSISILDSWHPEILESGVAPNPTAAARPG
jgi:hypothetical protein